MKKKATKSKTAIEEKPSSKIFWAIMYLVLAIIISFSSVFIFNRTYYTSFYVDGTSMSPTLNKDTRYKEFGLVDSHIDDYYTIDGNPENNLLKRFDIVITYYKADFKGLDANNIINMSRDDVLSHKITDANTKTGDPNSKIKRVIGFPGETITITKSTSQHPNQIFVTKPGEEKQLLDLPFTPNNIRGLDRKFEKAEDIENGYKTVTLKKDEFYVMGDNWGPSGDSSSDSVGPVHFNFMTGVLISIQGTCTVDSVTDSIISKKYYSMPRSFKQ